MQFSYVMRKDILETCILLLLSNYAIQGEDELGCKKKFKWRVNHIMYLECDMKYAVTIKNSVQDIETSNREIDTRE